LFKIPGYEIGERIGEGGSSEVFRAVRADGGQTVALKVLHARYCADLSMRKRLTREAKVISALQHANIVKIYKFGSLEDRFYIILEYLPGGSLSTFQKLSPRQRLKVVIQVCDAVSYIHRHGIVHRDLKPSNIMFGEDQIPRLVDFGISLFRNEDFTRLTHTNMVMGTLSYMSPEQQSDPSSVDHRSDIYALGAILYEIFTRKRPVGRFENPSQLDPHFDKELEVCILRSLAHRREERYDDVIDLRNHLVALWKKGLYQDGGVPMVETFDDRIGYWLKKLEAGTVSQRMDARVRIVENARPEDAKRLIRICETSETEIRTALIPVLGKLGDRAAVPFLLSQATNPLLAREACEALGNLGDQRAVEPLLRIVKGHQVYAHHALVPLAALGEEKHLKAVLPYLKDKNPIDRGAAVRAFEKRPSRRYRKDLEKAYRVEKDAEIKNRLYTLVQRIRVGA